MVSEACKVEELKPVSATMDSRPDAKKYMKHILDDNGGAKYRIVCIPLYIAITRTLGLRCSCELTWWDCGDPMASQFDSCWTMWPVILQQNGRRSCDVESSMLEWNRCEQNCTEHNNNREIVEAAHNIRLVCNRLHKCYWKSHKLTLVNLQVNKSTAAVELINILPWLRDVSSV